MGPPRLLEGEHSFQLQGKSWRAVDGESFVSAKEAERAVRLNQLHRPVVEVDPHLDSATLEVIPALALDFTCRITEREQVSSLVQTAVRFLFLAGSGEALSHPVPPSTALSKLPTMVLGDLLAHSSLGLCGCEAVSTVPCSSFILTVFTNISA